MSLSGIPPSNIFSPKDQYFDNATLQQWQRHQDRVLRSSITQHQQDYFLKIDLLTACSSEEKQRLDQGQRDKVHSLSKSIFSVLPQADTVAVCVLLRTLASLDDFARWDAHHPRRAIHPDIHHDSVKRCWFVLLGKLLNES